MHDGIRLETAVVVMQMSNPAHDLEHHGRQGWRRHKQTSPLAHMITSMPTFTREEIDHLADLARIALTDEEVTRLQGELNVIADAINKVQEVASDEVRPTANPVPLEAYMRPDVPETPLTQEQALSGAPVSEAGMFVAPRILEED